MFVVLILAIMKPVKYAFVCEKPPVKSNNFMNNQVNTKIKTLQTRFIFTLT